MGGETIALIGGSSASTRRLRPQESGLLELHGTDSGSPLQSTLLWTSADSHNVLLRLLGSAG